MVYIVCIDVVFAVNTIMGVMIPAISNKALSYGTTKRRFLTGAMIGGIWFCVVSVTPGLPPAVGVLGTYVAVSNLMAVAVYHLKSAREIMKLVADIHLVSMVLGEAMLMSYEHTKARYYVWKILRIGQGSGIPVLARIFMMTGAILTCYDFPGEIEGLIRPMAHRKGLYRIILKYREREEEVIGLIDTGSRPRKPVSGQPVHVAIDGLMGRLCPAVKEMVYVPYQSVGTNHGVLPAVYIDRMEVEQEGRIYYVKKPSVAITKQNLFLSGEYQILI